MFWEIALALVLSRILSELFDRANQPAVIGEILAGVLLGAYILGYALKGLMGGDHYKDFLDFESLEFDAFSRMGIVFLLFMSGLEVDLDQLNRTKKVAFISTIGGVALPLVLGFGVGQLFGFDTTESLVIGVLLTATSVGVTARTMMDMGVLNTDVGAVSLSASVLDDVLGIILLVLVLGTGDPAFLLEEIVLFFLIALGVALFILHRLLSFCDEWLRTSKSLLAITLAVCFFFAELAEHMGLAAIIGAFIAGALMGNTIQSRRIVDDVKTMAYGLFIPIFFVQVGVHVELSAFQSFHVVALSVVILVVAIVGKVVGRGAGAVFAGMTPKEGLQLGVGSIPRMEVALIAVFTAIRSGVVGDAFADDILAATVIFTIVSTLITPPLLKMVFKEETGAGKQEPVS